MIKDALINALQTQAESLEVVGRQDPTFDDLCLYYNRSLNSRPLAIARPTSGDQVSKVVSFCTAHGISLAVRSGGHDFFGRSLVHDGIVIDMRAMSSVAIAADRKTASVGGGVIAGDLQQTLARHGLFTPTGQAKTVGYVSWACGGGYGFYVGTYGFGVDQITEAKVVLADGRIVDTDHDAELLWALRGAGAGTFGVVVELRVKVYPTPKLYAGFLGFPVAEAPAVLEQFQRLIAEEGIPDEFSGDAIVANPAMLQLPSSSGPAYIFYWCWTAIEGGLSEAKTYLARMKNFGTVLVDSVEETTPAAFGGGDSSSPTFFRCRNVSALGADVGKVLALNPPTQTLSAIVVHNNHGKGVQQEIEDGIGGAFPNRRPHVILGLHGGTRMDVQYDEKALEESADWVRRLKTQISALDCCLNEGFPAFSPPDRVGPLSFFGPETARRLFRLKEKLDPDNVFAQSFPELVGKPPTRG